MTAPISEPDTTTPAKPRRGRLWAAAAAGVAAAIIAGPALVATTRGGDDPTAQPTSTPTATPTPDATPSPEPSTPEEQAKAEIEQTVSTYYATTNELFSSSTKAYDDIANSTRGELREARILQHQFFRNSGQTFSRGEGVIYSSVEVTDLNLSADPPRAVVRVCSGVSAAGTDSQGLPTDFTTPMEITVYDAQYLPDGVNGAGQTRWFLTTSKPSGTSC